MTEQDEKGIVIVTDLNGVVSIRSVTKEDAEKRFLDACESVCSNWDEHDAEDIEAILDDGVYSTVGGTIIAIIWLDEEGNYEPLSVVGALESIKTPVLITKPLSRKEVQKHINKDGNLEVIIEIPLSEIMKCGYPDDFIDLCDELILEEGVFGGVNYQVVGCVPPKDDEYGGSILLKVTAEDYPSEDEDEDWE